VEFLAPTWNGSRKSRKPLKLKAFLRNTPETIGQNEKAPQSGAKSLTLRR
jgi:hypothetical protein